MIKTPSLKAAHALQSKDDVRNLYEVWADTYDTGFAMDQGYQIPQQVAAAYIEAGGVGPVLDVGAGTGLVGAELRTVGIDTVDGVDLSPDMLRVARSKKIYRTLIEADITQPLSGAPKYAGIVSAGTFTLGHVGPEGVLALFKGSAPKTLFVISVHANHYESAGFAALLDDLKDRITSPNLKQINIYDERADPEHRDQKSILLIFRTI